MRYATEGTQKRMFHCLNLFLFGYPGHDFSRLVSSYKNRPPIAGQTSHFATTILSGILYSPTIP
jgi:hypothetical protein